MRIEYFIVSWLLMNDFSETCVPQYYSSVNHKKIQWHSDSTLMWIQWNQSHRYKYVWYVIIFFVIAILIFLGTQKNAQPNNRYDDIKFLTFLDDECDSYCHKHSIATDGKVRCCNMRNLANHVSKLKATIGRWHQNTVVVEGK